MNKKITLKFVIETYCFTFLMWGSIIIANQFGYLKYGTPLFMVLFALGGLAPPIVAVTLLLKNKVMPAKQLFKTIFAIKQPALMYLCAIGFAALYFGIAPIFGIFKLTSPIYLSLLTFPIMMVGGGFEEVGWRFVLQPALEKKLPFVIATSITAIIWSLWHLPLFFIEGTNQHTINFGIFVIGSFGLSFAFAAIYRLSNSIWLCIFLHSLVNSLYESFRMMFDLPFVPAFVTAAVLIIVATLLVFIAKRRQNLHVKD